MGIKPTEGEVRAEFERWIKRETQFDLELDLGGGYAFGGAHAAFRGWKASRANLLAEQANAVPVAEVKVEVVDALLVPQEPTETMVGEAVYNTNRKYHNNPVDELIVRQVWSTMLWARPMTSHPPKNTNPLNHPTQDLYEHFLAVHNLYHTEDLRKAFYHGAGEHTPEELAGFEAKRESHD